MRVLYSFSKFILFHDLDDYDYISYSCLIDHPDVIYLYFETINGEINSPPFIVDYQVLSDLIYYDCCVVAVNKKNITCLEVKK